MSGKRHEEIRMQMFKNILNKSMWNGTPKKVLAGPFERDATRYGCEKKVKRWKEMLLERIGVTNELFAEHGLNKHLSNMVMDYLLEFPVTIKKDIGYSYMIGCCYCINPRDYCIVSFTNVGLHD